MKTRRLFSFLAMGVAALAMMFTSCKPEGDEPSGDTTKDLQLSKTSVVVEAGQSVAITATSNGTDVTSQVAWTSSDEAVAIVEANAVKGIAEGEATITASYSGKTATIAVTVIAASGGGADDPRLNGSDYIVLQMDETTFTKLGSKVLADLRPNGSYDEGGNLTPEGADAVVQIWNPTAEIKNVDCVGPNSFGLVEPWFATGAVSPTPEGGWGNVCGGVLLMQSGGRLGELQKITKDHKFCVTLKGKYSQTNTMEIGLKGQDNTEYWETVKVTKVTGANADGDWETFEVSSPIDYSIPYTADTQTFMFRAAGAGSEVNVDCVFFYIPAK